MAAEIPNGMGCWKATRKSCIARDASRWRAGPVRDRGYDGVPMRSDAARHPIRADRARTTDVTPFDRLGPIRRAPRLVGRRRLGAPAARRAPVRAAGPGRAERRRLHPRRPRVGPGQGAPRARARRSRRRPSSSSSRSPTLEAGTPAFEARGRRRRRATSPTAPHVARRRVAPARAAPGLGRRPHRLRHRLPRPAAGRLARRAADPARAPARRARPRRRAGRRPGVLRRRPDGLRGGPAAERAHLAAAGRAGPLVVFGSLVAAGVPLVGRRGGGHRRAGRRSSSSPRSRR